MSCRFNDLVESIESVLLPLLTQIPSPDLYNLAPPSSPSKSHTPHSTTQDHADRITKATMDAIENCKEEVPGHLETNQISLDGSVRENLVKVMVTCSQLAASDNYLQHKKDKVQCTKIYYLLTIHKIFFLLDSPSRTFKCT